MHADAHHNTTAHATKTAGIVAPPLANDALIAALWDQYKVAMALEDACVDFQDNDSLLEISLAERGDEHRHRAAQFLFAICAVQAGSATGAAIQAKALRSYQMVNWDTPERERFRAFAIISIVRALAFIDDAAEAELIEGFGIDDPFLLRVPVELDSRNKRRAA